MKGSHFYSGHNRINPVVSNASGSDQQPKSNPLYWTRQGQKLSFRHHRIQVKAAQSTTTSGLPAIVGGNSESAAPSASPVLSLSQQRLAKFKRLGKKLPMAKRLMELAASASSQHASRSASSDSMAQGGRDEQEARNREASVDGDEGSAGISSEKPHHQDRKSGHSKRQLMPYSRSLTLYDETEVLQTLVPTSHSSMEPSSSRASAMATQQRASFLWPKASSADEDGTNDSLLDIEAQADDTLL